MRLSESQDTVERLYRRLADALRRSRIEPFSSPVTVAEIYQELVPYRQVREEMGFSMNADYEHALLSLLAGAGERVRLEPQTARDVIARELKMPNPNVSIYREYAACDVWVLEPEEAAAGTDAPADDDESGLEWLEGLGEEELGSALGTFAFLDQPDRPEPRTGDAPPPPPRPEPRPEPAPPPPPPQPRPEPAPPQPRAAQPAAEPAAPREVAGAQPAAPEREPDAAAAAEGRCAFCDSSLPAGRQVRFCPWCGGDQSTRPCGACGEVVEQQWLFCVACGTPAAS
jgi:hypothetical protein